MEETLTDFYRYVAIALSITYPLGARAAGCDDYPFTNGMNVEDVKGGTKIIATASVGVSFKDTDSVNDSRDEATVAAKAMIAKFFQESVTSDEVINRAVKETKSMQGDSKQVVRDEVIQRVKTLRNKSAALLRGVVPLGDCYTEGKEMRVSVGLKPETIASAGNAADSIGKSVQTQPNVPSPSAAAPNSSNRGSSTQPLNPVPGFSNSEGLKKF
jgi:hypothetical protein